MNALNDKYKEALNVEAENIQQLDVPLKLEKGDRQNWIIVSGIAASIAALFIVGLMFWQSNQNQRRMQNALAQLTQLEIDKAVAFENTYKKQTLKLNLAGRKISESSQTVKKFNQKVAKFIN